MILRLSEVVHMQKHLFLYMYYFRYEVTSGQYSFVACDALGASQFILAYHGGRVEAVLTVGNKNGGNALNLLLKQQYILYN